MILAKPSVIIYKRIVRPVMFQFHPDRAHHGVTTLLHVSGKVPGIPAVTRRVLNRRHKELEIDWKGMHFSSPVGLSAGLDKNGQLVTMVKALGFGFTEVGSVTAEPCAGNEKPWFYRLPKTGSLVVHVGLANIGVKRVLERMHALPATLQKDFPKILSVARTNSAEASGVEEGIADFVASIKAAKKSPAIQAVEVNISCPNAFCGQAFTDPKLFERLMTAIDEVKLKKPLFIKLPVDQPWKETKKILDIAVAHGVTGVTVANLTKDRAQLELKDELPDHVQGSFSGTPVRARSTDLVRKIYKSHGKDLIIIGVGGVMSAEDAYEKIKAGATFVELITGLIMRGPFIEEVNSGLVRLLKADGYTHISDAVGKE